MKLLLACTIFLVSCTSSQAQQFASVAGQEAAFNKKYTLTASIDEKTMTLKWSTNAPVIKAVLSVYTKEQLAVRKGTDHLYPFNKPVKAYQFNLNAPAYKGFHAYWLKVYTKDSLWQEYYFQRRAVTSIDTAALLQQGYTLIRTSIHCDAGAVKITAALKSLDGVTDVKVDSATGILAILYSTDGTPYVQILDAINEQGFDADGQVSKKKGTGPCSPKKAQQ